MDSKILYLFNGMMMSDHCGLLDLNGNSKVISATIFDMVRLDVIMLAFFKSDPLTVTFLSILFMILSFVGPTRCADDILSVVIAFWAETWSLA